MVKYKWLSYLLLFFGGFLCLHLLYLGRHRHAFVWWCTGCLGGIGLLSDFWNMPAYIAFANLDGDVRTGRTQCASVNDKPSFLSGRFFAQLLFAVFLGLLLKFALPYDFEKHSPLIPGVLISMAIAIGVHAVGNIGDQEVPFKPAFYGSFILFPFFPAPDGIIFKAIFSCCYSRRKRRFRRGQQRNSRTRLKISLNIAKTVFIGMFVMAVWGSVIYNHILTKDGDTARVIHRTKVFLRYQQKRILLALEATKPFIAKVCSFLLIMLNESLRVNTDFVEDILLRAVKCCQSIPGILGELQRFAIALGKTVLAVIKDKVYPLAKQTCDHVAKKIGNFWDMIKHFSKKMWDSLLATTRDYVEDLSLRAVKCCQSISGILGEIQRFAIALGKTFLAKIKDKIYPLAKQTCDLVAKKIGDFWDMIKHFSKKMWDSLLATTREEIFRERAFATVWSDVKTFINSQLNIVRSFFRNDSEPVLKFVQESNPYKVLGLKPGDSNDDIKRQYRKLAKTYHPDKYKDRNNKKVAHKIFRQIAEARDTLLKSNKRF